MKQFALAIATIAALLAGSVIAQPYQRSRMFATPLPEPRGGDPAKIQLGRELFFDRRMSRSTRLSCASCHDLSTNGASSASRDEGNSGRVMRFNTPTVFNSVFNFRQGWEGRTRDLRGLAFGLLRTDHLMSSKGLPVQRLAADTTMAARFRNVYGVGPNERNVADALASFMGTLVTPDAPFDRWLRGDKAALTAQQIRGHTRFQVLGCASCHQGTNLGGNIFQRRGIFHPLGEARPRYLRVPSLRNVGVTAPYFHDGHERSLPVAIRRMARAQLDLTISDRDAKDIVAFLHSLTGTYQGRPLRPQT